MRHWKWILLPAVFLLAACAQHAVRDSGSSQSQQPIDYAKYVQAPVPWFHFTSLYSWESHQPGYVVVWTSPRKAYRLTLVGPCIGLASAGGAIGLTSHAGLVTANRDAVIASGHRCPIMRIDRLNAKALRARRDNKKTANGKGG